jgi:hypothetical protein
MARVSAQRSASSDPGQAFTSMTAPVGAGRAGRPIGEAMSGSRRSTPQTSSPAAAAARQHITLTSGWIRSVTSVLVPPVDRLALRRSVTTVPGLGTEPGCSPWVARWASASLSNAIRVSGRAWPTPRRGSALVIPTSAWMSCTPSPATAAGRSCAAAATRPSTTSTR